MTIGLLIISVRAFLNKVKFGFLRIEDLDRALIFSELSERDFKAAGRELFMNTNIYTNDHQDREKSLAAFLAALERAKSEHRTSYCVIGRPGRSLAEFMDFLSIHRLPTAPFTALLNQKNRSQGLDIHGIRTAVKTHYFPVEIIL